MNEMTKYSLDTITLNSASDYRAIYDTTGLLWEKQIIIRPYP